MSRIKQEIDKAIEHYGDQAIVFRVVRMAIRIWENRLISNLIMFDQYANSAMVLAVEVIAEIKRRRKLYIHHIRRLLPIERPVTTERLHSYYIDEQATKDAERFHEELVNQQAMERKE